MTLIHDRVQKLVYVDQGEHPDVEALRDFVAHGLAPVLTSGTWAMISDVRKVAHSDLDSRTLQAIMRRVDAQIECLSTGGTRKFRLALLASPRSLGYGMARMIEGHHWAYTRFEVGVFDDPDQLAQWLEISPNWEAELRAA